jgi:hypothetical protein
MARKTVLVSDLSGSEIRDEKDSAQVVIKYGDARRGQVTLDVLASEVNDLASKGRKTARRGRRAKVDLGRASFEEAKVLISDLFRTREWIPSSEIHSKLEHRLSDPMFGRVKKALEIEHRRVGGRDGQVEWRRPSKGT